MGVIAAGARARVPDVFQVAIFICFRRHWAGLLSRVIALDQSFVARADAALRLWQ